MRSVNLIKGGRRSSPLQGDLCTTQGASARCQSDQGAAVLSPLLGERQIPAYPPEIGEGSSGHALTPSNHHCRTPNTGPAPLHPLLGERQTPPYPAAIGEGSSGQPPPSPPQSHVRTPSPTRPSSEQPTSRLPKPFMVSLPKAPAEPNPSVPAPTCYEDFAMIRPVS